MYHKEAKSTKKKGVEQMFPRFKLGGGDKPQSKGIEVKDNSIPFVSL